MDAPDLHAVGDRIESLLDELRSSAEGRVWLRIEELVQLLTELYGAGMGRTLELAADQPDLIARMGRDELVGSLLLLHGLHPAPLEQRVAEAMEAVTPVLRKGDASVEVTHVDAAAATVTVTLTAPVGGCGSGAMIEVVREALDDVAADAEIEVKLADPPPPLIPVRLGRKPVAAGPPA